MPVLTSGSSTTVTLGDYDSITLQNRPGQQASITVAGTLVNGSHTGSRTYGPYNSSTSVSITATVGDLYYEVADGVAPSTPGSGSVAVQPDGRETEIVNESGGFPAVLRGTVSATRWPGVVTGTVDTAQRNANRVALQAAIDYAGANRKFFEFPPDLVELDGGFLSINYNNFTWRGSRDSRLLSYVTNQPIIHVGFPFGNSGTRNNINMRGARLMYATSQTSSQRSSALELTGVWNSDFSEFDIGDPYTVGTSPTDVAIADVFNGVAFDSTSAAAACFSNTFRSFRVKSFAGTALLLSTRTTASATGNVWENTYISNGSTATNRRIATDALRIEYASQNVFDQMNIEWAQLQRMAFLNTARNQHFYGTNFERVTLYSPTVTRSGFIMLTSSSQIESGGLHFKNCSVDTGVANGNTVANTIATAGLLSLADNCSFDAQKLWYEDVTASGGAAVDIVISDSAAGNSGPDVSIGSYWAGGTNNVSKAWNFTQSGSATRAINAPLMFGDNKNPRDTISTLADADATLYVFRNSGINIVTPTVARTLTLSPLNRASGFTNPPGASFHFVVPSGAAGSIALRNLTSGGTLIKTLSAGQWGKVVFDGTNWQLVEFGSL